MAMTADGRLKELREANDGKAITVWKDGGYRVWSKLDAKYAERDSGWLATIPLDEFLEPTAPIGRVT